MFGHGFQERLFIDSSLGLGMRYVWLHASGLVFSLLCPVPPSHIFDGQCRKVGRERDGWTEFSCVPRSRVKKKKEKERGEFGHLVVDIRRAGLRLGEEASIPDESMQGGKVRIPAACETARVESLSETILCRA